MTKLTAVVCRNFANAREGAWTCTVLLELGERHMDVICWGYEPRAPTRLKSNSLLLLLLLLLFDMDVSCHRPFFPGTSLEPAVIPTAQASSFTLQYFPYYV